ncbi:MAG TPA: glycosyltransferase family 39 protein [Thermoanaerobaculia bacterium]|nr:glycosyltransferase family 39 protein [Thermoanaerobaculia bacterium]
MPLVATRPDRASAASRRAALAAALLFIGLALFGAHYHWMEEAGTAERDGYVSQAEQLLAGELPKDPFRPPFYPLLTAGLGGAIGDPFAAARLISNLAAACLAWIAWRTGRELGGKEAGGSNGESTGDAIGAWAFAATAVNPNLWIIGQHTTTDMTFGALAAGALLAGLIYLKRPGPRPAWIAGALLGLAAFTRGNAIFLLPGLLLSFLLAGKPFGPRLRHLLYSGLAALPGYAALWAWRFSAFGDPFHDENWKNVAWKLYGYPDWSYLDRVPFHGLGEIVRADPLGILRGGFSELGRFATSGLAQLVGTPLHAALFVAAGLWLIFRKDRAAIWLLGAGFLFLFAVAFSFFTWGRLLLCLLPTANAVAFAALLSISVGAELASAPRRQFPRAEASSAPTSARPGLRWPLPRKLALGLAAVLVLSLGVKTAFRRLPAFVDRHPYLEVATLRRIENSLPPGTRLGGTSPFLDRYLAHPYVAIPDAFGPELREPRLYLDRLEHIVRTERITYLVMGKLDLRDRPRSLLGPEPPAPWLVPVQRGAGVVVWRVR